MKLILFINQLSSFERRSPFYTLIDQASEAPQVPQVQTIQNNPNQNAFYNPTYFPNGINAQSNPNLAPIYNGALNQNLPYNYPYLINNQYNHNNPNQPIYNNAVNQPIYNNALNQPIYNNALNQPIYNNAFSQPIYNNAFSQPIYNNAFSQPLYNNGLYPYKPTYVDSYNPISYPSYPSYQPQNPLIYNQLYDGRPIYNPYNPYPVNPDLYNGIYPHESSIPKPDSPFPGLNIGSSTIDALNITNLQNYFKPGIGGLILGSDGASLFNPTPPQGSSFLGGAASGLSGFVPLGSMFGTAENGGLFEFIRPKKKPKEIIIENSISEPDPNSYYRFEDSYDNGSDSFNAQKSDRANVEHKDLYQFDMNRNYTQLLHEQALKTDFLMKQLIG